MRSLLAFLSLGLISLLANGENLVAVRAARLWDGERVVERPVILIENGKVKEITSKVPKGAQVVDWSRLYVLPGLIDVHTHMTYYWDRKPGTRPRGGQRNLPAVTVYLAQDNARRTLETGVTTVRDLGASDYSDIAMRDLIQMGAMKGPRMFVSGYGLQLRRPDQPVIGGRALNAEEVVQAVDRQVKAGADVIKVYGSVGGFDNVNTTQTFQFAEMKAAVEAAHAAQKKIAIHSYGPEGARDAVRAGADSLEHAVDIDDDTLQEMARRKTFYVPTIDHNRYYIDAAKDYQFPEAAVPNLRGYIERNLETARRAHRAGVRFAMGSDAVFTMFGQNTAELRWFVKAGMTPEQALRTATVNAAELLGAEREIGRIQPGSFADLVAVEGDPLADVEVVISKVRQVMRGGVVVHSATKH